MGDLAQSELVRGLSEQALMRLNVGSQPDNAPTTYTGVVESMRRCLTLHREAGTWLAGDKIAAADILACAGFTASDIVEHLDEAMTGRSLSRTTSNFTRSLIPNIKLQKGALSMKAVRSVKREIECKYTGSEKPKHKVGDYVRIYCGSDEDHCFVIKGVRFNYDLGKFQYLREGFLGSDWRTEGTIVDGDSRKGWHYDSQGYCDNPGRGY